MGCGLQLLRQRRGLRRWRERGDHGSRHRGSRLATPGLRAVDQGVLGCRRQRPQHEQHLESEVPASLHRGLSRSVAGRFRGPAVLSPRRPQHPPRGDGVGDERSGRSGQGVVLGYERVDRRRDSRRVGDRRASPSAQAGHGTAAVQHARASTRRGRVQASVRGHRTGCHHLESAGFGRVDREVHRWCAR